MYDTVSFYMCSCGNSWAAVLQEPVLLKCEECDQASMPMVSYSLLDKDFVNLVLDSYLKIASLEELCGRAYMEIDENFEKLCDDDGYGPMSLISDLEKVKNGKEYKGLTLVVEQLHKALKKKIAN